MTEVLVLALGVPTALVAAWLLWRRSWSQAFADIRGIALQTVIVIVVLLVIAGGVAGVLLSRGQDTIGQLEAASVGIVNAQTCATIDIGDKTGGTWDATTTPNAPTCTVTSTANNGMTAGQCGIFGGVYAPNGSNPETCTITVSG